MTQNYSSPSLTKETATETQTSTYYFVYSNRPHKSLSVRRDLQILKQIDDISTIDSWHIAAALIYWLLGIYCKTLT